MLLPVVLISSSPRDRGRSSITKLTLAWMVGWLAPGCFSCCPRFPMEVASTFYDQRKPR